MKSDVPVSEAFERSDRSCKAGANDGVASGGGGGVEKVEKDKESEENAEEENAAAVDRCRRLGYYRV